MPNDSSAVSDLIRQTHGRRLRTDPADLVLFDCTNRAQPAPPKRSPLPARRPAAPRLLDAVLPDPEPATHALDRFESPVPTVPAQAEPRDRIWPFVVATIVMAALGILVPAYVTGALDFDDRMPPIALPSVTPSAPTTPVVTHVEPTPAPVVAPATPTDTTSAATTPDTPPAPPTVAAAPAVPAKVPPRSKRVASKRAKPAVAQAVATPVAPKPAAKLIIEPEPPRPAPRKRQQQAADSENPL